LRLYACPAGRKWGRDEPYADRYAEPETTKGPRSRRDPSGIAGSSTWARTRDLRI